MPPAGACSGAPARVPVQIDPGRPIPADSVTNYGEHRGRLNMITLEEGLRDRAAAPDHVCRRSKNTGFVPPAERYADLFVCALGRLRRCLGLGPPALP